VLKTGDVPRAKYLIVAELDESLPRRDAGKPHLYVGLTVVEPDKRFEQLRSRQVSSQFGGHYVRLRLDLTLFDGVQLSQDEARVALSSEKKRLAQLGHAINGIAKVWNCYVIDLEPPGKVVNANARHVYVGQSEHSPDERFAIHKGPKPLPPKRDLRSGVVHRRGKQLNYELMDSLEPRGPFFTQEDALAAERAWAQELDRRGFHVAAGDATPGRKVGSGT